MFEQLSYIRRLSQLGTVLKSRFVGLYVGEDQFCNRYYKAKRKNSSGTESRWVLYGGEPEASLVPPEWFAWLHHQCDEPLPSEGENRYVWQKPHQPNLTGSEAAYLPDGHGLCRLGRVCAKSN